MGRCERAEVTVATRGEVAGVALGCVTVPSGMDAEEAPRNSDNSAVTAKPRKPKGKPRGKPFASGASGNPKGRPPMPEDTKLAFKRLDLRAIEGLETVLLNPAHPRFEQACEYVIDRNHGKAVSTLELTGKNGGPMESADVTERVEGLNSEQAAKRMAELMAKMTAAKATGEASPDGPKP
jgi:hypothetical protein